ncbi:MAG TPA: tetratricopeptide repeat protein, partial [Verrucomicrobiae bacterium]
HKALQLLRGAAYNGYVPAQLHLGQKYKNGIDMPRNETEANVWFRKAADMGNAEAQFSLGEYFALAPTGHGDLAQGLRWLRMAARQNHAEAAALLDKLTNTEVASEEQQAA